MSFSGITSFDLAATVTSPGGLCEDAEIQEVEDGLYSVVFVPKELGVHTVSVKYREIHIPGESVIITYLHVQLLINFLKSASITETIRAIGFPLMGTAIN